jgi:ATP-binding cassette, subfamily B, multidrug efflux pump
MAQEASSESAAPAASPDDHKAVSPAPSALSGIRQGRVEFRDVSFSYDGRTEVLKQISFTAEPGQTVALVGHTGSGKSSIISLLMHFYKAREGTITIDGVSLDQLDNEELRGHVGLVLQDPFLFAGTINDNIRLHSEDITDEEIEEAARFVQADAFIQQLQDGYDQPLGERVDTVRRAASIAVIRPDDGA